MQPSNLSRGVSTAVVNEVTPELDHLRGMLIFLENCMSRPTEPRT